MSQDKPLKLWTMAELWDELSRWQSYAKSYENRERALRDEIMRRPRGVLSDQEILEALEREDIAIDPFDRSRLHPAGCRNLNTASYDIRLGEWYYLCEAMPFESDFNPWDPEDVERYYNGPLRAVTNQEWCEKYRQGRLWKEIPADALIIVLRPGECILGHTQEYIGSRRDVVTMMHARSSIGRVNISTCDDAGWGDIGYINRWTMEIRNKNNAVVPLVVGERVGQIIFFASGLTTRSYGSEGHYQLSTDLNELQQLWRPEDMLPRLQLDCVIQGEDHD